MMRKALLAAAVALIVAPAHADVLFRADFQNGRTTGWGATGSGDVRLSSYAGNISLRLTAPAAAVATVSAKGYKDIAISYAFAATGLSDGACQGEVSTDGGQSWTSLFRIDRGQDDGVTLHTGGGAVPDGADKILRIRLQAAGQGGTCWADNIVVTGTRIAALPGAFAVGGVRQQLTRADLDGNAMTEPVSTAAFTPPAKAKPTLNHFEGRLVLEPSQPQVRVMRDDYDDFSKPASGARQLPPFDFAFVQSGNALIPVRRGAVRSLSREWEFVLEPGRVWDEPGDGGYSRASLPFTLEERNANCMHNGLLTFLFKNGGGISHVAYQIGSETCLYSKFDMWGWAAARYVPETIANTAAVATAYNSEIAHRLPVKPIADLAKDFPGTDPTQFGSGSEIDPTDMTLYGVVAKGVNYVGGCATRFGPYPYCAEMDLPSYSLAKSIFAGEAAMRLALLYPGAMQSKIADYVPECAKAGTWGDVTFENALDMATGHYNSPADQADEDASDIQPFFLADTHRGRIDFACNHYPRQARPGTRWVYHTADTYLLGTAMRAFYRSKTRPDAAFYNDMLVDPIFKPLHLDPAIAVTRRSYDDVREPFAGWGLTLHRDDIAKLAMFLSLDGGKIGGKQLLDPRMLAAALQRDPSDPGLTAATKDYRYNNGFWAWNVQEALGCIKPIWIPFMSGYGGITVAMMPNGIIYYYVSDGGKFAWAKAAVEANRMKPFCERPSDGG